MKKIVSMLLAVVMCCGLLVGCGEKEAPKLKGSESISKVQDEESTKDITVQDEEGVVLPHNRELKLSDTQDVIASKETLTKSEYGIEGLWDSSATWHIENSDYEISYSFSEDGAIQYVTYLLVDSSLSDIELGFIEVTTKGELWEIYGDGDGNWTVDSNGEEYTVTLERKNEDHCVILKIMKA